MSLPAVKLRDKRKPGHCWQDNELYDCFQPVIGALAVGVYARLTRECVGTTLQGVSLRDLAELCGLSKSAVQRAFAVMEMVGLLVATRTSSRRSPVYELADLKELAISYDAEFDPQRYSYILKPEKRLELRTKVSELKRGTRGPGVPMGDTESEVEDDPVSRYGASGVPLQTHRCPANGKKNGGNRLSKNTRIQKEQIHTPPLQAGVEIREVGLRNEDGPWIASWNGVLKDLHEALVVNRPTAVQDRLGGGDDWQKYFAAMACEGVDRRGGAAGRVIVRVPDARTAQQGLVKYHKRIHAGMHKYFGREVPVMLVDSG